MKPIVALTDFSPISLNAVNYAADLAVAIKSDLVLLHVCQLPVIYSEVPVAADSLTITFEQAEEKINLLKKEVLQRTRGKIEVTGVVRTGTVITEIESYCSSADPAIIVMGTQGSSAVERLFFGNITISAIKKFSWPLIVLPPEAKFANIKKIGLACDPEKKVALRPVEEIKALVQLFGAKLHVLQINKKDETETKALQKMLEDVHPVFHSLRNKNVEEGLNKFAGKNKLDLLIVIPGKHSLVGQLFHKSHSKQLALHAHVPVMAVHE